MDSNHPRRLYGFRKPNIGSRAVITSFWLTPTFAPTPSSNAFHFVVHEPGKSHKAPQSPALEEALKQAQLQYQLSFEPPSQPTDP